MRLQNIHLLFNFFFFYKNYVITQCMNKIKTRRSTGTKMLRVLGTNEIKMI